MYTMSVSFRPSPGGLAAAGLRQRANGLQPLREHHRGIKRGPAARFVGNHLDVCAPHLVAARGLIFAGDCQDVRAIQASTGSVAWQAEIQDFASGPEVLGSMLFVGSHDGVVALDAKTGEGLWLTELRSHIFRMTVGEGRVFILGGHGLIWALKASTGRLLWTGVLPTTPQSDPAVRQGVVYVGTPARSVVALDASTGRELWKAQTPGKVFSTPVVGGGSVYVGANNGRLYAFAASTGLPLWLRRLANLPLNREPALAGGVLYVSTAVFEGGDFVTALTASNGRVLWSARVGDFGNPAPSVANGVVYQASGDRNLYALDARTGRMLSSFPTHKGMVTSPVVVNGMVFLSSDQLYAFSLR